MKTSQAGINLIKRYEQCRLTAYFDNLGGVWTIGWGHTETAKEKMVITQEMADSLFNRDVEKREIALNNEISLAISKKFVTQGMFDALMSLTYNAGLNNCAAIIQRVNACNLEQVVQSWMLYNKSGNPLVFTLGLARRRWAELGLILN